MTTKKCPKNTGDIVNSFNPTVHGARGLFALMIFFFHVFNSKLPTLPLIDQGWLNYILMSNEFGVELFFGISGIVIYGAILRSDGPIQFLIERATRIFPLLWITIFSVLAGQFLTGQHLYKNHSIFSWPALIASNMLALPGILSMPLIHPAAWSLSFEMTFYVVCASAWALRLRLGRVARLIYIPLAAIILGNYIGAFLMVSGLIVSYQLNSSRIAKFLAFSPTLWILIFLISWKYTTDHCGFPMPSRVINLFNRGLLPIVIISIVSGTLALVGLFNGIGRLSRLLRARVFQWFGTISFSLYLWHPLIMGVVKQAMYHFHLVDRLGHFSQLVFLLLTLPPTLLISAVSQALIERRLTRWLRARLEKNPLPVFGPAHAMPAQIAD